MVTMITLADIVDDFLSELNNVVLEMVRNCIRDDHMDETSFLARLDEGGYTYEGEYGFIHFTENHKVLLELEPRFPNPFNWHFERQGDKINQKIVLDIELAFEKAIQ